MKSNKLLVSRFLEEKTTNMRKAHVQTFFKRGHIYITLD